jgi:hypothetical protein
MDTNSSAGRRSSSFSKVEPTCSVRLLQHSACGMSFASSESSDSSEDASLQSASTRAFAKARKLFRTAWLLEPWKLTESYGMFAIV